MKIIGFYDSHGGLWENCSADDPGAEAFGPRGISRRVDGPTWSEAKAAGRIYKDDWDFLLEEPFFSEEGRSAVPGLLPGGMIIIESSPPLEGGEELNLDLDGSKTVKVWVFETKHLYIQATLEETEVWASAQIDWCHRNFSGCDWCCGGGDQLLALYQDVLRAAT